MKVVKETLYKSSIEEGLLGHKKPKRITDGLEMDWVTDIIDKIEIEENIDRDKAISIMEDNIDLLRDLYKRNWNTYETYMELKNKLR